MMESMAVTLRKGRTADELRTAVDGLAIQASNLSAYDTSFVRLRGAYLAWVEDARRAARDYLAGVHPDQFTTQRYRMMLERTAPAENRWIVVTGDTEAQLQWFRDVLDELEEAPIPQAPSIPSLVRSDIWEAAGKAWSAGLPEEAVFNAFKRVEAVVQERLGSKSIGDPLVMEAFGDGTTPPRLDIATDKRDVRRLRQLFAGSIGLFKGDRSHGDEPAIPVGDDTAYGLRLLMSASALLDLLDRDVTIAPLVRGLPHQGAPDILTFWADRAGPSVRVFVDGSEVKVVSRLGEQIQVSIEDFAAGTHALVLQDGPHRSRPQGFDSWSEPPAMSWHRVLTIDVPVYADAQANVIRPERAVLLESHESGNKYRRVFPSATTAQPGQYVTWEWNAEVPGVDESWVRVQNEVLYGWTGSMFFAGVGRSPLHEPRPTRLVVRPSPVRLRPGSAMPLRVMAAYSDGVGSWTEDVTHKVRAVSNDWAIAFVEKSGVVRAKASGRCRVDVDGLGLHTRAEIVVTALPSNSRIEYLGGLFGPRAVATRDDALLVVSNSDVVWKMADNDRLHPLVAVERPYLAVAGLDQIAVGPAGELAVRDMSRGRGEMLWIVDESSGRSVRLHLPDDDVTPMASAWTDNGLMVADHKGGFWLIETAGATGPVTARRRWTGLPNPTQLAVDDGRLLVLWRSSAMLVAFDLESHAVVDEPLSDHDLTGVTSIAVDPRGLWAAEFYTGRLWLIGADNRQLITEGLRNPSSLAVGADGSVYVAEFGADVVARILP